MGRIAQPLDVEQAHITEVLPRGYMKVYPLLNRLLIVHPPADIPANILADILADILVDILGPAVANPKIQDVVDAFYLSCLFALGTTS
jgi:hypothetical protein